MKDRIKSLRKSERLTQEGFASRIGLSRNFIAQIELGTKVPSNRTIADICRTFNVSEVWLRTGEGDPRIKLGEDAEFIKICKEINISDDLIKRIIKAYWKLDEKEKAVIRKLIDSF